MEYSIGFFGGIALSYSVLSSKWPDETDSPKNWENNVSLFFVFIFIPWPFSTNRWVMPTF